MSIWDSLTGRKKKPQAVAFNPNLNNSLNPGQLERLRMNPNWDPSVNPGALDLDSDGINDELEPKRHKNFGQNMNNMNNMNNPAIQNIPGNFHPKQKGLLSQNKCVTEDGTYVSTCTYPLPPVAFEKKQFDNNRKIRNKYNQYLQ